MRTLLFLLLVATVFDINAQQNTSTSYLSDIKFTSSKSWKDAYLKDPDYIKGLSGDSARKLKRKYRRWQSDSTELNLPVFAIQGLGNINQEALKSINASGKLSFVARPYQHASTALTIYASYNKNASNNDSILYQKLIFPEIGNSSFIGTVEFNKFWKPDSIITHSLNPFLEFAYKNIKSDSSFENQTLYFSTLQYTLGLKYLFGYQKFDPVVSKKKNYLSFSISPYLSLLNIPNEDIDDYRALLGRNVKLNGPISNLTDKIWTAGVKIGFYVNGLQIFSDFRSVLNKSEKVPIRELQGFSANIGVVFNADVLEYYRK
jgi:hypothetical protein